MNFELIRNIWCRTKRRVQSGVVNFNVIEETAEKTFSKAFGLIHHLNLHDNNLYKCYFCPWGCSAGLNQSIDIHLNQHFGTPQYDCSFCDKKFYWKQHLTTHMEIYHEKIEGKYGCSYCQYKTHSKVSLCLHIGRLHTGTVAKNKSKFK